jgi:hypothetical protein
MKWSYLIPCSIACIPDKYCQTLAGSLSYCRTWLNPATCQGASQYALCDVCGGSTNAPMTTKQMIMTGSATLGGGVTTTSTKTTSTTTRSMTTSTTTMTLYPGSRTTSSCELVSIDPVSMFVWIEGPSYLSSRLDFEVFFTRIANFVVSNCVNIKPYTLIIRTPNPFFTAGADSIYWPPWASPLYTRLVSKVAGVKILLYPYILDGYSRSQWVNFGTKVLKQSTPAVLDAIFGFASKWQQFVNGNNTSKIEGFIIDNEEVLYSLDKTVYPVSLTPSSISPLKILYPLVKTGVTIGYDDKTRINFFDTFMDYLFLQVYDLYYPFVGSDASVDSSIFEVFRDDPTSLVSVLTTNVLKSSILSNYKGREARIFLMWSTQYIDEKNCLYKLNDGSCGVNYEFNWRPYFFNKFVQEIMQSSPVLSSVSHGVYTFNFMRQDWLIKSDRN